MLLVSRRLCGKPQRCLGYAVGNLVRVSKGVSFEFKSILLPLIAAYSAVLCDVVSSHYYRILREIELPVVCAERPFPISRLITALKQSLSYELAV